MKDPFSLLAMGPRAGLGALTTASEALEKLLVPLPATRLLPVQSPPPLLLLLNTSAQAASSLRAACLLFAGQSCRRNWKRGSTS